MPVVQSLLQYVGLTFLSFLHRLLPYLPRFISSHVYSLIFTISLALTVAPPLQKSTTILKTRTRTLETHLITTPQTPPTRTIIVIHGLAATAHSDPRILNLASAIATALPHAVVVVPHIPPLANCDLADNPVELVEDVIETIANDHTLCPSRQVSVASACISAGFCLVAASRLKSYVQSMLMIGPHSHVKNVLQHCVDRKFQGDTRYAWKSVLASFLTPRTPLRDMLVAYVTDDHYRNLGMHAAEVDRLLPLHPEEAKEYKRLHEDDKYLEQVLHDLYRDHEKTFLEMSPLESVKSFDCDNLVLIHSDTDDVVPYSESLLFAHAIRSQGGNVAHCVTTLLDHGDQKQVGVSDLPEVWKLIHSFTGFFGPRPSAIKAKQIRTLADDQKHANH